jgi:hypothetical protein
VNSDISTGYRSDHTNVSVCLNINEIERGRGYWKFNNSLLKDIEYVNLVKSTIENVIKQYAVTPYNLENIMTIHPSDLNFVINDQLFFDMLLLEIRGKTISYSSFKKKENNRKEKELIVEIENLERQHTNLDDHTMETIANKKNELEVLRSKKIDGAMLRSRVKWLDAGEKPSSFFLNLEKRNCVNKKINRVVGADGLNKCTSRGIQNECFHFYEKLYSEKNLQPVHLQNFMISDNFAKLNEYQKQDLEGPIQYEELILALKKMQNNKSPGLDGYTVEFFKMFFNDISWYLLRSLNESFESGCLPNTQRRGVITLLPKGQKPREFLKNWRPISLLNVSYKLASSCIANRLKRVLPDIISSDQSGFMAGRFIGENIRQVYDIMNYTEKNNIPGLLLLIDFEKAFDSVSHNFIFKVLDLLNFGESFKKWISVFYKFAQSTVLVNGHMTPFFDIKSGCRQGDGLSPYIFLLCSQILNIAINNNRDIKGITINNMEYKVLQYADDTTIILDGTERSLRATLNLLDVFYNISGLKINIEKTSAVWIGSKKGSNEILCTDYKMSWVGVKCFGYLGVTLCTDLNAIVNINYTSTMQAITKQIHHWSKRFLTVLGRIVVVKTLLLPKLNHLVLSLPSPEGNLISEINSNFHHFIWGGKTDRISRNQMALPCNKGGTGMIQLDCFMKALKITWIRRLLKYDNNSKIYNLFKVNAPVYNFDYSSQEYWNYVVKNCHNDFWKQVFISWRDYTSLLFPMSRDQVLCSSIWNNTNIKVGGKSVFYKTWDNHGIRYINDLLSTDGDFMSLGEVQNKYDVKMNFLNYHGIKKAICKPFSYMLCDSNNTLQIPYQGFNTSMILKEAKGCKQLYNVFLSGMKVKFKCIDKWNYLLDINLSDKEWFNISHYNWKCTQEVKLRWFQFRLLNRILCTNTLLVKINRSDNPNCTFCNEVEESFIHLFWDCKFTRNYWKDFQCWVSSTLNENVLLTQHLILFGNYNFKDYVFNNILLLLKFNIYKSRVKQEKPSFAYGKKDLEMFFLQERFMYNINMDNNKFDIRWHKWKSVFVN